VAVVGGAGDPPAVRRPQPHALPWGGPPALELSFVALSRVGGERPWRSTDGRRAPGALPTRPEPHHCRTPHVPGSVKNGLQLA